MAPVSAIDVLYQPAEGTCSTPEAALHEMDEAGVAVALIAPCSKLTCERQWACVDTRLEDVARFLQASIRFAGLCGYNPFDVAESFREMDAARGLGFRGVFVSLSAFGLELGDRRFYPLFARASELQMPVVLQCAEAEPTRTLRQIGRDFPELLMAIAPDELEPKLLDAADEIEVLNFVLDSPTLWALAGAQPDRLARVSDRCMWGSKGAPLSATVAQAQALSLPPGVLPAILRANALRFFAATPPARPARAMETFITTAER